MNDKEGREYARLSAIKDGDTIEIDSGFTCASPGFHTVHKDDGGLFFVCKEGHHYLEGQADNGIHCVGIYIPR